MAASARNSMEASKEVDLSAATGAADSHVASTADICAATASQAPSNSDSAADPTATTAADAPNREEPPGRGDGGSEDGGGGDSASWDSASGDGGGPSLQGTTKSDPVSTPKTLSRSSSNGKAAKGFGLETLGSDLYVPGEVSFVSG